MQIPGYTPNEKLEIAKQYLVDKAIKNNGLDDYELTFKEKTLTEIITGYTKESGVRELERLVNTVARKIATEAVVKNYKEGKKFNITSNQLP